MMMSGQLCDWIAAVVRGCRSLRPIVSMLTLKPSAFSASASIVLRRISSPAGTKSFHFSQLTVVVWANAGAWPVARMPAMPPAPEAFRNLRRVTRTMWFLPGAPALISRIHAASVGRWGQARQSDSGRIASVSSRTKRSQQRHGLCSEALDLPVALLVRADEIENDVADPRFVKTN